MNRRQKEQVAHHARVLGKRDPQVDNWFIKGMAALADEHSVEEWLELLMEFGSINLQCMALLYETNTGTYGTPTPTQVPLMIEKSPFIVVTGHDLHDHKMLLEQSDGKGVNVYTHSEMLPAHAYQELKKYPHLKGIFGTAWQAQQKEFDNIPGDLLPFFGPGFWGNKSAIRYFSTPGGCCPHMCPHPVF